MIEDYIHSNPEGMAWPYTVKHLKQTKSRRDGMTLSMKHGIPFNPEGMT